MRKQKILDILENNDLSFEIKEEIKDIIQEDIDATIEVPLTDEDKQAINTATDEMSEGVQKVEDELSKDMEFVDEQLSNLEAMVKDLDKVIDEVEIEQIKSTI